MVKGRLRTYNIRLTSGGSLDCGTGTKQANVSKLEHTARGTGRYDDRFPSTYIARFPRYKKFLHIPCDLLHEGLEFDTMDGSVRLLVCIYIHMSYHTFCILLFVCLAHIIMVGVSELVCLWSVVTRLLIGIVIVFNS
jgi:hypothetical protein